MDIQSKNLPRQPRQFVEGEYIGGEYLVRKVFGGAGKSGMGVVYLVSSREHPDPFILKTSQKPFDKKEVTASQRFLREAEAWIKLGTHPNIVHAYFVRIIDDQIYIAAEYIPKDSEERNSLSDYIEDGIQPDEAKARWAIEFCEGMGYVKTKGIVAHRDIKPDNLMIAPDGHLKITDFGLVRIDQLPEIVREENRLRVVYPTQMQPLTRENSAIGTFTYMAPEQFQDSANVDHRADIYAFGVTLYQLATGGDYPYQLRNQPDIFQMFAEGHFFGRVIPFNSPFFSIIERCLQKQKDKRFQSFTELADEVISVSKQNHICLPPKTTIRGDAAADLYSKAQSYCALGNPSKALEAINEYIHLLPDNYDGWTEKGRIHLEMGDIESAITATQASIERWPENAHAWNNLGVAFFRYKQWGKAAGAFRKAVSFDPYNTGAMMQLALSLVNMRLYEEATQWILKALDISPTKETLLFNARNMAAVMMQHNYLKVSLLLEKLVQIDPTHLNTWINLALLYQTTNRFQEAISCYKKAEAIKPDDDEVLLFLAKLFAQIGRIKESLIYCDKLILIPSQSSKAVLLKAQILSHSGQFGEAISLLKEGIRRDPSRDEFWFILANIYEQQGDIRQALNVANQCKQLLIKSGATTSDNMDMVNQLIFRLQHYK